MARALQIKSYARQKSRNEISLSFLNRNGWVGSFRIFFRNGRLLYTLKHCTPSQRGYDQPQVIPDLPDDLITGEGDVFTIEMTSQSLMVFINGVEVLDYDFSDAERGACSEKYRQPVTTISFWKIDSASESYRSRSKF